MYSTLFRSSVIWELDIFAFAGSRTNKNIFAFAGSRTNKNIFAFAGSRTKKNIFAFAGSRTNKFKLVLFFPLLLCACLINHKISFKMRAF